MEKNKTSQVNDNIDSTQNDGLLSATNKENVADLENTRQAARLRINYAVSTAYAEAKKAVLIAKQAALNSVYEQAVTKLMNMTDNLYRELIAKLISKYAENNDTVMVSERDLKRITPDFIKNEASKLKINLSLSSDCHSERGGIILLGKTYDKNVTFKTLIDEVRAETESKIARKLFEC